MGDLTLHFSEAEFACKCNCGLASIDPSLVDLIEESRQETGIAFEITSGCRCIAHNTSVGGKENSAHLLFTDELCHAADIKCSNSHQMYLMGKNLIEKFKRIEFGKSVKGNLWIHVDNRLDLPQEVIFLV